MAHVKARPTRGNRPLQCIKLAATLEIRPSGGPEQKFTFSDLSEPQGGIQKSQLKSANIFIKFQPAFRIGVFTCT